MGTEGKPISVIIYQVLLFNDLQCAAEMSIHPSISRWEDLVTDMDSGFSDQLFITHQSINQPQYSSLIDTNNNLMKLTEQGVFSHEYRNGSIH